MRRQRPGLKVFKTPGPDFGVKVVQPAAPPGLIPFSLYYDGNDDTDCGNDASVMDLHQNPMTVDAYWRCPALADLANWTRYCLAAQGQYWVAGWELYVETQALPNGRAGIYWKDGGGTNRRTVTPNFVFVEGNWYYVRARRNAAHQFCISVNAGAESSSGWVAGGIASAENLMLGQAGGNSDHLEGHECYVHVWPNDQGALGAIPGTPFPIGGAARYIHSEGAGPVLGDTSGNGNNGTINGATWSPLVPLGWTL